MSCHILIWHMWRLWQYEWKTEWSNSLDFIYIALTILITWNVLTMWMPLTYIRERIYFLFKLLFLLMIWEFEYTSSLPYPSSHFTSLFPTQIHVFFFFCKFNRSLTRVCTVHILLGVRPSIDWHTRNHISKKIVSFPEAITPQWALPIPWFQMYCWQADLKQACRPL